MYVVIKFAAFGFVGISIEIEDEQRWTKVKGIAMIS